MIKQDIARGLKFDWIGGDGLYGHSTQLCHALDDLEQFFVLDVHKSETIYLEEPVISIPKKQGKRGRKPIKLKADKQAISLSEFIKKLSSNEWKNEYIRDSTKGKLHLYVYKKTVWTWDKKENKARKRTLIITKKRGKKSKIKYSLSNGEEQAYTYQEYAYFVAQRYWVERSFDNAKNELAMSDFQTRKWKAWHHHHSLMLLASLFIMKQQIDNQEEAPLLSFRDARILIILQVFGTQEEIDLRLKQMEKRHEKRKYDIERCCKKQKNK